VSSANVGAARVIPQAKVVNGNLVVIAAGLPLRTARLLIQLLNDVLDRRHQNRRADLRATTGDVRDRSAVEIKTFGAIGCVGYEARSPDERQRNPGAVGPLAKDARCDEKRTYMR
jgi:hypothetical protein